MRAKVQKWGNSLAIRIPRAFAEELGVRQDSKVDLLLKHEELVVKPVHAVKYSLSALLAKVRDENIHGEVATGEPVGREVW